MFRIGKVPPYAKMDFPEPKPFRQFIGPAFFMSGLAVGAGELIAIPRANLLYGADIMWIFLVACVLQTFINLEVVRYTLVTGESFQLGSSRLWRPFGPIWGGINFYSWIWGNIYAYGTGAAFAAVFGGPVVAWVIVAYAVIVAIVVLPRWIYGFMEKILMVAVFLCVIVTLIVTIVLGSMEPGYAAAPLIGQFKFGVVPPGVSPAILLGAAAAAGTGGTGNLWYSYATREKGFGIGGAITGRIMGIRGKPEPYVTSGYMPEPTPENIRKFKAWFRVAKLDQLMWFILVYIGIILFTVAAYAALKPLGITPAGYKLVLEYSNIFAKVVGPIGVGIFLFFAAIWLWSTQIGIIDQWSRMNSDVLYTHVERSRKRTLRFWYYVWLIVLVGFGIGIIPLGTPAAIMDIFLATLGITMPFYTLFLLIMNNKLLPKPYRPGIIANIMMVAAIIFFGSMSAAIVIR